MRQLSKRSNPHVARSLPPPEIEPIHPPVGVEAHHHMHRVVAAFRAYHQYRNVCGMRLDCSVVASLRSKWDARALPPAFLKLVLKQTTSARPSTSRQKDRLGSGILDAKAAYDEIARILP